MRRTPEERCASSQRAGERARTQVARGVAPVAGCVAGSLDHRGAGRAPLDSPGPVLFRQLRVGSCHKDRVELFEMIKFRSMCSDAEKSSGAVWATKSDSRITTVGKFLRKSRLDELPQLINVLKGDMSLIGPRPERPLSRAAAAWCSARS